VQWRPRPTWFYKDNEIVYIARAFSLTRFRLLVGGDMASTGVMKSEEHAGDALTSLKTGRFVIGNENYALAA
jgi:hypothetical protein